jgi:hypothetical protein
VYFNYNDTSNAAQIYTGSEPIGEEEANWIGAICNIKRTVL